MEGPNGSELKGNAEWMDVPVLIATGLFKEKKEAGIY